jgi:methyltransferase
MVIHPVMIAVLAVTVVERLVELVVSKRNMNRAYEEGGVEYGAGHYPFMVVLHTLFLVGCLVEPIVMDRPFLPALAYPMVALAVACQALRWWVIRTLGWRWNTRVVVVPGLEPIEHGPFRWLRHPNYLAVVVEGFALPLIHTSWITALAFTVLNAGLLWVRIGVEERALDEAASGMIPTGGTP